MLWRIDFHTDYSARRGAIIRRTHEHTALDRSCFSRLLGYLCSFDQPNGLNQRSRW